MFNEAVTEQQCTENFISWNISDNGGWATRPSDTNNTHAALRTAMNYKDNAPGFVNPDNPSTTNPYYNAYQNYLAYYEPIYEALEDKLVTVSKVSGANVRSGESPTAGDRLPTNDQLFVLSYNEIVNTACIVYINGDSCACKPDGLGSGFSEQYMFFTSSNVKGTSNNYTYHYYTGVTSSDGKSLVRKNKNGTSVIWWTRTQSACHHNFQICVNANGVMTPLSFGGGDYQSAYEGDTLSGIYVVPCFCL